MKYRVLCHILVFLLCVGGLLAQTVLQDSLKLRTSWNTVFLEFLGNGGFISASYEGAISSNLSIRAGIGWTASTLFMPCTISTYIGANEHRGEVGGGLILLPGYIQQPLKEFPFAATARLGYRYHPLLGGLNFGIAFTPILGYGLSTRTIQVVPWGGISLGWGF